MSFIDLSGTGVAIVTPFKKDQSIDFDSLGKILTHVAKGKVEFLVVMGTTGESPTLNSQEKKELLNFVVENNANKLPIVYGIGGNCTKDIVDTLKNSDLSEVSAILSVAPYYNKPKQEGIYQHFKAIAEASPKPIILYNVPGRTSSNIKARTTLRLANDFENIIAVKEASGDFGQIMTILKNKPKDFQVLSGDDALTFPMIALGATGSIAVIANAFPSKYSEMIRLANNGQFGEAKALHYELLELMHAQFEEGNPTGIKAVLKTLELCEPYVRLPLVTASSELKKKINQLVTEIK